MATLEARAEATPAPSEPAEPSVLAVLVVRDGDAWLRQCLMGLANQTHPRIGVLAIDNGSTDGSADLLEAALGPDRVVRGRDNIGFGGAVALAMASDAAQRADYVLLLHDDTALDPSAVASLVEAAERVEGVGVVGPKVLDWDQPRVLREVGLSTDRFGYPYSPLEEDEIDQGQYDRIREVLYVSSCAMLISRRAWNRIGPPDERLSPAPDDLDFCWRARLAGFRVLMTPKAVARHRGATSRGERTGGAGPRRARYDIERVALASILKNYGLLSLVWILPLYFLQGLGRLGVLAATRRFQDAYQVLAAWAWNAVHFPGTLRRRVRAQAVRSVPDRSVRRSMAPAWIRLRRWAHTAAQSLLPGSLGEEDEELAPRAVRALRVARAHPVATAWGLAVLVAAVAYRDLLGVSPLTGGGLGSFPDSPVGFFRELLSGLRHTGLGGSHAASPALGVLGVGSVITLGSPALLEKVLLLGLPAVAAGACYRAVREVTHDTLPASVAAACYALSSLVLWGVSEGRIPALAFLAGLPWLVGKLAQPFDRGFRIQPARWLAGAGIGLAVLGSFFPGAVLAAGLVIAATALLPSTSAQRLRGILLTLCAVLVAAVLALPLTLELIRGGAGGLMDHGGQPSFAALARLSLGVGPGSWPTGFFLPVAAALSLVFLSQGVTRLALRSALAGALSLYMAWLAAAGYLPEALSNPVAYLGVAAFAMALLVGLGLADLLRGVGEATFGHRQLAAAAMAVVLGVGLGGQALQAAAGTWSVGGPNRAEPAYAIVGEAGAYRVLWIGDRQGDTFPAPGGLPDGVVAAGSASVRFAIRDPSGASVLDTGRPSSGDGYSALKTALSQVLAGETHHGGALLAPFGIRFVVARSGDLPVAAFHRMAGQVDLNQVPTRGLTIFRNEKAAPVAGLTENSDWRRAAGSADPLALEMLSAPRAEPLTATTDQSFELPVSSRSSLVLLGQQFDPRWKLRSPGGEPIAPLRAFGWAVGFRAESLPAGSGVTFGGQRSRTEEMVLLAALWAAALWLTRRPLKHG
jgi:GT2 family glycosyltransferase